MPRTRPDRLRHIKGIGVDAMGDLADIRGSPDTPPRDLLRLENLDINIPPHPAVLATAKAAIDSHSSSSTITSSQHNTLPNTNSYLPFTGHMDLRNTVAKHVNTLSSVSPPYTGQSNVVITTGGLNGISKQRPFKPILPSQNFLNMTESADLKQRICTDLIFSQRPPRHRPTRRRSHRHRPNLHWPHQPRPPCRRHADLRPPALHIRLRMDPRPS